MTVKDRTKYFLKEVIEQNFNENNFKNFVDELLNLEKTDIINGSNKIPKLDEHKKYIDSYKIYANYKDKNGNNIGIFIIKINDYKDPAAARVMQRNYIGRLLDEYDLDASLTAIYSLNDSTWRLSFVKRELSVKLGKLHKELSPAKRYSYLFGKDEPNHTAEIRLLSLIECIDHKITLDELEEQFSVEKVTDEFFKIYKDNYLKLKDNLDKNTDFIVESKRCGFSSEEFAKKLMGQIVFIYFLQKKGWLGVQLVPEIISINDYNEIYFNLDLLGQRVLNDYYYKKNNDSDNMYIKMNKLENIECNSEEIDILSDAFLNTKFNKEWGTGEKKFIRHMFNVCQNRTTSKNKFFDDYLEPFFYNGLNLKRKNQYFSIMNCKVPFLNGGLFEPLNNYKWTIANFNIPDDIFSNEKGDGILDFFDRFNFTMNEEEPLEKEVAVDPEMLGKIFENLLEIKDRKSKGAFYTPREIVHYMCKESLANYLANKVKVNYEQIKEFIFYGDMIRDFDLKEATIEKQYIGNTIFEKLLEVDKALKDIKVADPAVGSGAFSLGILNEIVSLRDKLTSYIILKNKFGMLDKMYEPEMIENRRNSYDMKWNIIKNSIYAVDIENSAVDITKLRLWLSLVVDQNEVPKEGPEPLPNLDFKIMQGNSLVDEYKGIKLVKDSLIDECKDITNVKVNNSKKAIFADQLELGDGTIKANIEKLINLKQELYNNKLPDRKIQLLDEIKKYRNSILSLSFSGSNAYENLLEQENIHQKSYFAWKLEFIEVFIENGGFDIVIGNPPYLDYRQIDAVTKTYLSSHSYCSTFTKMGSLYTYFIELGLNMCNKFGTLNFINPYQYLNADSGYGIRRFIFDNEFYFKKIIDVSNIKVFKSADTYTCINLIDKNKNVLFDLYSTDDLYNLEKNHKCINYDICNKDDTKKIILNSNTIVDKMDKLKLKISDICDMFCGSSDTGLKNYIFPSNLIDNKNYYPYIITSDFNKYIYKYDKCVDISKYPVSKSEVFKDVNKLFIGRMTKQIRCIYVEEAMACGKVNCVCNIKINPIVLCALFNSKLISYYYAIKNEAKHLSGGYFGMDIPSLLAIPYSENINDYENEITEAYNNQNYDEIDLYIFKAYDISDEEIEMIEGVNYEKK